MNARRDATRRHDWLAHGAPARPNDAPTPTAGTHDGTPRCAAIRESRRGGQTMAAGAGELGTHRPNETPSARIAATATARNAGTRWPENAPAGWLYGSPMDN